MAGACTTTGSQPPPQGHSPRGAGAHTVPRRLPGVAHPPTPPRHPGPRHGSPTAAAWPTASASVPAATASGASGSRPAPPPPPPHPPRQALCNPTANGAPPRGATRGGGVALPGLWAAGFRTAVARRGRPAGAASEGAPSRGRRSGE